MDQVQKDFWRRSAIVFVVLVALAVAGWFGRSYYRHFKEHRAQQQAQAFLAKGDFRNALLCAMQARQLNPANLPAARVLAALADLSHNPAALDIQQQIVQTEPTVENKLQLASLGLRYQTPPFPLTAQILTELEPSATNLPAYHIVAAGLALNLHRLDRAENHFQLAAKLEPTNRLYELNLAVLRLGMTNEAAAAQARQVLLQFSRGTNFAVPALRALVTDRLAHADPASANIYSTQLLAGAQAGLPDRLQHLTILRRLDAPDFAARLRELQQQGATNAIAVAEISGWMLGNNLLADDFRWLTNLPPAIRAQLPVKLALADVYLQTSDWKTLRDFISKDTWDEMDFFRFALAARAWEKLGLSQVADSNWNSAINESGNRLGSLTTLLGLTERWNRPRERERLLEVIARKFPREFWASQALEQLYMAGGNTAALGELYARLAALAPNHAGYKNNLAYTLLLLKTNLNQANRLAAEAYAGHASDPVIASTYAYSLYLQGRAADGLAALKKLDAAQLEQPDVALFYGLLLAASGDTNAAGHCFTIASAKTQWLPEEKRLLMELEAH
jgi:tetratricopeptide (TPR) repeat protein